MTISDRLNAIAEMVPSCEVMADIGTDHGYLPIELVKRGLVGKAYAMDINKGPLLRAQTNIERAGESDKVKTILSNGLENLPEDTEVIVIAGMGGMLIGKILEASKSKLGTVDNLVLSPHLDASALRRKVHSLGYKLDKEQMVIDQGKYYNIFTCSKGKEIYTEIEYAYGKELIQHKPLLFVASLREEISRNNQVLDRLMASESEGASKRISEINEINKIIEAVLNDA